MCAQLLDMAFLSLNCCLSRCRCAQYPGAWSRGNLGCCYSRWRVRQQTAGARCPSHGTYGRPSVPADRAIVLETSGPPPADTSVSFPAGTPRTSCFGTAPRRTSCSPDCRSRPGPFADSGQDGHRGGAAPARRLRSGLLMSMPIRGGARLDLRVRPVLLRARRGRGKSIAVTERSRSARGRTRPVHRRSDRAAAHPSGRSGSPHRADCPPRRTSWPLPNEDELRRLRGTRPRRAGWFPSPRKSCWMATLRSPLSPSFTGAVRVSARIPRGRRALGPVHLPCHRSNGSVSLSEAGSAPDGPRARAGSCMDADVAPLDHLAATMRRHPPVEVPGLAPLHRRGSGISRVRYRSYHRVAARPTAGRSGSA